MMDSGSGNAKSHERKTVELQVTRSYTGAKTILQYRMLERLSFVLCMTANSKLVDSAIVGAIYSSNRGVT